MNRRTRNIILSIVGLLTLFGVGVGYVALTSGGSSPAGTVAGATSMPSVSASASSSSTRVQPVESETTTSPAIVPTTEPTASSALPVPGTNSILPKAAYGTLDSAMEDKLFNNTVVVLQPEAWFQGDGDGDSQDYADNTTCSANDLKSCAKIEFINLVGANKVNYGSNPITAWARNVCPERSIDAVQGPAQFNAGGEMAGYYLFTCNGSNFYAWYVPSRHLLVTGKDGSGNALEVGIVQAVMERIQFKS